MADESRWYVVHTYSGYENKVASNLEKTVENRQLHDLIQEIRVPTETVTEVKDGKQRDVERKIFPGYVLVKILVYCPQYSRLYWLRRSLFQADSSDGCRSSASGCRAEGSGTFLYRRRFRSDY